MIPGNNARSKFSVKKRLVFLALGLAILAIDLLFLTTDIEIFTRDNKFAILVNPARPINRIEVNEYNKPPKIITDANTIQTAISFLRKNEKRWDYAGNHKAKEFSLEISFFSKNVKEPLATLYLGWNYLYDDSNPKDDYYKYISEDEATSLRHLVGF